MIAWQSIKPHNLWYFVGLITTDGCLSGDERHVDITSKDKNFLESLRKYLTISNVVSQKRSGIGKTYYRIQIGGVEFYNFLRSLGLMPNKSLKLSKINIERPYFCDFLRGVIDGDGSIRSWHHPINGGLQWSLRLYSGSHEFLQWLREEIHLNFLASGQLYKDSRGLYTLKFGKLAAQQILSRCYYTDCLSLNKKQNLAINCVLALNGWKRSKTVGRVAERQTLRTQDGSPQRQLWGNKSLKFGEN